VALPDNQAARLLCYKNALRNWAFEGFVVANITKRRGRYVEEWLVNELPQYTWREICRELHEYVTIGGQIDEQVETRLDYAHYEFHYDLRVLIGGRRIYFETVLSCDDPDDPDDPRILVVNVHDV
jgi:hypothetical protein